ncbi:hypothetical protein PoB_002183100 [Plakobranchus ocellatus]|uniref:Uncharacterized protein n=1 Tax=Plakobranchus ocellatus TaxID=259542 RepID=A0AAV3ZHF2_9GAST|nr:hypothetical protein PoB_002183100 [Plakobranchus ocellatus]
MSPQQELDVPQISPVESDSDNRKLTRFAVDVWQNDLRVSRPRYKCVPAYFRPLRRLLMIMVAMVVGMKLMVAVMVMVTITYYSQLG